jgi:hypothetical protein
MTREYVRLSEHLSIYGKEKKLCQDAGMSTKTPTKHWASVS